MLVKKKFLTANIFIHISVAIILDWEIASTHLCTAYGPYRENHECQYLD